MIDQKEFDAYEWVDQEKSFEILHPIRRNLGKTAINYLNNVKS